MRGHSKGKTQEHEALIVGAGPTGLTLAAELALAGIDVAIVERRESPDLVGWRAGGLHARTLELFDQRGIGERFMAAGRAAQVAGFAWIRLDIGDLPTRRNHGLALRQSEIERILADWVAEFSVPIHRGCEAIGLAQDDDGVTLQLADGRTFRGAFLIGCDGGRSFVRKQAKIAFPGWDPTISNLIAEVEMTGAPEIGLRHDASGVHSIGKVEDGATFRVLVTERETGGRDEPTLRDLAEALIAAYGSDFGVHSPTSISRFTDMTRQAATYRAGRVTLAGDAAHIHYPVGGQGLNLGVQDAMNLGWKLAQVIRSVSPDRLLDTYEAERRPVAARALKATMAQVALLRRAEDRLTALRETLAELLEIEGARKSLGATMSGLDIRYGSGDGHPLLGRRMPDLDVMALPGGKLRVFDLLHRGRPALMNFSWPGAIEIPERFEQVQLVDARYEGVWDLPVIGAVPPPAAVLIRPDGHVAWVGGGSVHGLDEALTTWFGSSEA